MDDMRVCQTCHEMFSEDDAAFVTEGGDGEWVCPACGSRETITFEEFQDYDAQAQDRYESQGGYD